MLDEATVQLLSAKHTSNLSGLHEHVRPARRVTEPRSTCWLVPAGIGFMPAGNRQRGDAVLNSRDLAPCRKLLLGTCAVLRAS